MKEKDTTQIIIARHGESRGNLENRFRGRRDFPLNERGLKQAEELAGALARYEPSMIFSSPLTRAVETANPLSRHLGIPVNTVEGFNNIYLAHWEGRLKSEIAQEEPEKWNTWITYPEKLDIPGGESFQSVQERSFQALEDIVREHPGETVVVLSHRTTIKPLLAACIGICEPYFWKVHVDTASFSIVHHSAQRGYCLFMLNQTCHLSELNIEWN